MGENLKYEVFLSSDRKEVCSVDIMSISTPRVSHCAVGALTPSHEGGEMEIIVEKNSGSVRTSDSN